MRKILLGSVAFLLLLGLAVAGLVFTQPGLSLVRAAVVRLVPGLEIREVQGTLLSFTARGVRWESPGIRVLVEEAEISSDLPEWRTRTIRLPLVRVRGAEVNVQTERIPASDPAQGSAPFSMGGWKLVWDALSLAEISASADGHDLRLAAAMAAGSLSDAGLTVESPRIGSLRWNAPPKTPAAPPAPAQGPFWKAPLAQWKALAKTSPEDALPAFEFPFPVTVTDLQAEGLGASSIGVRDASLGLQELHLEGPRLRVQDLSARAPGMGSVQGSLFWDSADDSPVRLEAKADWEASPVLPWTSAHVAAQGMLRGKTALSAQLGGALSVRLEGDVRLCEPGLPLNLRVSAPEAAWPWTEKTPRVRARDAELSLQGTAADLAAKLSGRLSAGTLEDVPVRLSAQLSPERTELSELVAQLPQGELSLRGDVTADDRISARLELSSDRFDPAAAAGLSAASSVSGAAKASVTLEADGAWTADVSSLDLHGTLAQAPVRLQGRVRRTADGRIEAPRLEAVLADNRVELSAQGTPENFRVRVQADAPRLGGIVPGLSGSLEGDVEAHGSLRRPVIRGELAARDLHAGGAGIRRARLTARGAGDQPSGSAELLVRGLEAGGVRVAAVSARAQGTPESHVLTVSVAGAPAEGSLRVQGGWNLQESRWSGTLSGIELSSAAGHWTQDGSAALSWDAQTGLGSVRDLRLAHPAASVRLVEATLGAQGSAHAELERLSMEFLSPWLDSEAKLSGALTGSADVQWDAARMQAPVQGRASLKSEGLSAERTLEDGRKAQLHVRSLSADFQGDGERARMGWELRLEGGAVTKGSVVLEDPTGARLLRGEASLKDLHLEPFSALLPRGDRMQGLVQGDVRISGSAAAPQLDGSITAEDLQVISSKLPFTMEKSRVKARFEGSRSTLAGELVSDRGSLSLEGEMQWSTGADARAVIRAKGENFGVHVRPWVHAAVSPDITLEADASGLKVTGEVEVPKALARVNDLPESAVAVSEDEILVDRAGVPVKKKEAAFPVRADVRVRLGKNVQVRAFGLQTHLDGAVRVMQTDQGLTVSGGIVLRDGSISQFGQNLQIRSGEIRFTGPADNPALSIEAIRDPESTDDGVTAGVRVTGTASRPKLDVFSEPSFIQQTVISYLLTGSADTSGEDRSAMMTSMLVGLGAAGVGRAVGSIGQSVGIDNLSVGTAGSGQDSSVVVSGYVLPGLQVKYGVGIFDSLATLTLRYRLLPSLYLEAVSGIEQVLSVLYEFEF